MLPSVYKFITSFVPKNSKTRCCYQVTPVYQSDASRYIPVNQLSCGHKIMVLIVRSRQLLLHTLYYIANDIFKISIDFHPKRTVLKHRSRCNLEVGKKIEIMQNLEFVGLIMLQSKYHNSKTKLDPAIKIRYYESLQNSDIGEDKNSILMIWGGLYRK